MEVIWLLVWMLAWPACAWWPGKMPTRVRQLAAGLALVPPLLALLFVGVLLVGRPRQLFVPAGSILLVLGMTILAGAYSLWPSAAPKKNRAVAAVFFLGPVLCLFLLVEVVKEARGGTVVGRVTWRGQPLPSGKVSILTEAGEVRTGDIRPNGRYTVLRVPPGPVRMAIHTYPSPPPGPVPVPASKYVPIPPRYRAFDKSRLAFLVTRGVQVQDIELQP
jgi:hypothetical protein